MPSASEILGGSAPPSTAPGSAGLGDVQARIDAMRSKPEERYQQVSAELDEAQARRDARLAGIEEQRGKLTAPEPVKPTAPPHVEMTDPKKAWGSMAMMAAMFGSMFTRKPLMTALNAAASAINAYHTKDTEAQKKAFDEWKLANDQALSMADFQWKSYQQTLAELDRRERLTQQDYDSRSRSIFAEARAKAVAFGDEKALAVLDLQGIEAFRRYQHDMQTVTQRMAENAGKVAEQQVKAQAIQEMMESPEYQKADPATKLAMIAQMDPKRATMTPYQKAQYVRQLQNDIDTRGVGKPYHELALRWGIVERAKNELGSQGVLDNETNNQLLELGTKILLNQAVRQGLLDIQTKHAGLIDQVARDVDRVTRPGGGGALVTSSAVKLIQILEDYRNNIDKLRDHQIKQTLRNAETFGIDPKQVYDPEVSGQEWETHKASAWVAPPAIRKDPAGMFQRALGVPVTITSEKRSPEKNAAVGGSVGSAHLSGNAWDFKPQGMSIQEAAGRLATVFNATNVPFDQILVEPTEGIVHVGFGSKNRRQVAQYNKHTKQLIPIGPGAKAGAAAYRSADDVARAYKSGKLTYNEAKKVLQQQFGIQ